MAQVWKFVHNMQAGQHWSKKMWHSLKNNYCPPSNDYDQGHDHHVVANCHWLCRLWVKICQKPVLVNIPKHELRSLCSGRVFLCPIYPSKMWACVCVRDILAYDLPPCTNPWHRPYGCSKHAAIIVDYSGYTPQLPVIIVGRCWYCRWLFLMTNPS